MACLGFRCSNKDYTYVVLSGSKNSPKVLEKNNISFPRGFSRPKALKWFLCEIEAILGKYPVRVIAIKGTEGIAARGRPFVERIENETMIYLAAANFDIRRVLKKTKNTIAKDLGVKGRSKYLSKMNYSVFPGFNNENDKMKDAIIVTWSSM